MQHTSLTMVFAGILVFTARTDAFEIRGRVVDYVKQSGLEGVTVSFVTLDGKPIDQVVTDTHGEFRKDVSHAHRQFRIAYAKASGGSDGLGYEGYGRTYPVDNNVKMKDVDTVALRPRKREATAVPTQEKDVIVKDWLSYYLVTKEQVGVSGAIRHYAIDEPAFGRSRQLLQLETGRELKTPSWGQLRAPGSMIGGPDRSRL
jgi:hypothetical protein